MTAAFDVVESRQAGRFECVFDESLPEPHALPDADDAAVVAAIAGWARVAAAASARRLAAVAELVNRRCTPESGAVSEHWACDEWDCTAAEVAAAQNIGHRAACGQMHQANALRHRLPRVGEMFLAGEIGQREASAIAWRTLLIVDPEALAAVDAEIVARATRWGRLSVVKLEQAVDAIVECHDPLALRRFRGAARGRDVQIGARDDAAGTSSMWARLLATDAAVLFRKLDAMARAVCSDDPRGLGERRADALGTLGAGGDVLACACGASGCAAAVQDSRAGAVVIHVVAAASSVAVPPDPPESADTPRRAQTLADALAPDQAPTPEGNDQTPGFIAGGGIVPAPLLAELVRLGAPVRPLLAVNVLCTESGYRPSIALQRFVRSRDLTCRFPGCDHPAEMCDVDHTIPHDEGGRTHPSNLKCLCRKHHLLKTFWAGVGGWTDRQMPDGVVIWTSPAAAVYVTHPGSRMSFPGWDTDTGSPPSASGRRGGPCADRGLAMPTRKRTRSEDLARRIRAERALNDPFRCRPVPF